VSWLLVAVGAGVGSALRFGLAHLFDGRWPTGTLVVNVAGSFLLGVLSGLALSGDAMALLGAGFCGGLTTFSSLLVQSADRGPRVGTAYLLSTVAAALLVCWLGFTLAA
jgi:CrcB protein